MIDDPQRLILARGFQDECAIAEQAALEAPLRKLMSATLTGGIMLRCSGEEIEAVTQVPRLDGYLTGSREALVLQEAGQPVELARVVVRVRRVAAGRELQPGAGVTLNREPRVPGQQPDPFRGGVAVPPDRDVDVGIDGGRRRA